MSLSKQTLKSKPVTKVTFTVPSEHCNGAKAVAVVGEFNGWDADATPLKKQKDGSFKGTVELTTGKEYQFRYLVDGEVWINETEADKFVASGISMEENSVVVL
ncbi:glycoside hydrolase [Siphonobacter sp. BAB-5385]|uniref:isoamylase early set domain-containing protein n=1 Tax=unclassified Siphonobacter TaxID=2635712 RepID=UPI000B9E6120|nr:MULTISPECIES: isoamylase early set domain-containing protein [unclassified Siphonobacter]OZI07486.1 glycoside hydrolase [Siphonobacter sp. BAB-5385]PMD98384.1 glycoside hydrolase [Siphonobacter sp. BAB-5405]